MGGTRGPTWAVALVSALVLLSGCTTAEKPVPTGSVTPQPPAPTEAPSLGPEAVMTIAGVDVDGLHLTVAGFVTDIDETGAACTFVATSAIDGREVSAATTSEGNSSSTSCGSAQLATADLSRGPWDVVLHFESATVTLESEPMRVEVP